MRAWLVAALVAMSMASTASASQAVTVEIDSAGGSELQGNDCRMGLEGAYFQAPGAAAEGTVEVAWSKARVQVVNYPYLEYYNPENGPIYENRVRQEQDPEVLESFTAASSRVHAPITATGFHMMLPADGELLAAAEACHVALGPATSIPPRTPNPAFAPVESGDPEWVLRSTHAPASSATPTNWTLDGDAHALYFGGPITLALDGSTRTIQSGTRGGPDESTSSPGLYRYDRIAVLIHGSPTELIADPQLTLAASSVRAAQATDILWSNAQGSVRTGSSNQILKGEVLQVIGAFDATGTFTEPGQATWALSGDATFVAVNGQTHLGERPTGAVAAAAAAGGLLAALLFSASNLGRELLAIFGLSRADPLENPTRRTILKALLEEPGATRMQLAQKSNRSRATVRHHLRILESSGLIHAVKDGKIPRYLPNGGTTTFRAPVKDKARPPPSKAAATGRDWFASQRHELQKWIMQATKSSAMTTTDLVRAAMGITGQDPTERQIRYHCQALHRAGLLEKQRRGRQVHWEPVHDVNEIHAEYTRRRTQGIEEIRPTLTISG